MNLHRPYTPPALSPSICQRDVRNPSLTVQWLHREMYPGLFSCGREWSSVLGVVPGGPMSATQGWRVAALFPFTLLQIQSLVEGTVWGTLKARVDMACPKAEVSLLQALRPEFCCLNYSCPSSCIFYCWGLMWRRRSRLIGLNIKFRNYFNNLIYYFGHFYRQLKLGYKESSE